MEAFLDHRIYYRQLDATKHKFKRVQARNVITTLIVTGKRSYAFLPLSL